MSTAKYSINTPTHQVQANAKYRTKLRAKSLTPTLCIPYRYEVFNRYQKIVWKITFKKKALNYLKFPRGVGFCTSQMMKRKMITIIDFFKTRIRRCLLVNCKHFQRCLLLDPSILGWLLAFYSYNGVIIIHYLLAGSKLCRYFVISGYRF